MLKQLFVISAIAGSCSLASAQTVSYKILSSDPRDYKPTVLSLDILNCDTYHDLSAGYGVKLETVVMGRLMPYINFKNSWYDGANHHLYNTYPVATGGAGKQMNLDAGAVLFLANSVKKKSVRVILKSSGNSHYTMTHFTNIPSEVKRMLGVGGGIFYNRKTLAIKDDASPYYKYKNTGTGAEVAMPTLTQPVAGQPAGDAYWAFPMSNTVSIYGGLHYRNIKNTVIWAEGWGKRANAKVVDFYIDLMAAPISTVSNVKDVSGKEWKMAPQKDAISYLGYKFGWSVHSSRSFGLYYYAEFGKRPGPVLGKGFMNNGSYISLGVGVSIGSSLQLNIKPKAKKTSETTNKSKSEKESEKDQEESDKK